MLTPSWLAGCLGHLVTVHCSLLLHSLTSPRAQLRAQPPLSPPGLHLVVVELVVGVAEVALASPPLRLQARLTPQSAPALRRARRSNVLQGGTAGQPGVVVGGGVGADVVVLLGDIMVPACIFTQNGTCLVDTNI